jgi:hypothetical protein
MVDNLFCTSVCPSVCLSVCPWQLQALFLSEI